jgi:hypothetical protein
VEKSRWHVTFQVPFVHFNGPRAGQRKIGRRSWMLVSWALTEKRQSRTHDAAAYFAHIAICASHPPVVGESREQMQQLHAVPLKCCEGLCFAVLCCRRKAVVGVVQGTELHSSEVPLCPSSLPPIRSFGSLLSDIPTLLSIAWMEARLAGEPRRYALL